MDDAEFFLVAVVWLIGFLMGVGFSSSWADKDKE